MDKESKVKIVTPSTQAKQSKIKVYTILGVFITLIISITVLSVDNSGKEIIKPKASKFVDLTPGENKDWRTEMQAQYKRIVRTNEEMNEKSEKTMQAALESMEITRAVVEKNKGLENEIESLKKKLDDYEKKPRSNAKNSIQSNNQSSSKNDQIKSLSERIDQQLKGEISKPAFADYVLPPPPGMSYNKAKNTSTVTSTETLTRLSDITPDVKGIHIFRARQDNYLEDDDAVPVEVTYIENQYAGLLPLGSFAKVSLLTGLDSGTSEYTRANPQPVLMRVQSHAQMSQGKYKLKSCFVLGSSYGDLSSERVFIQLSRISCVDKSREMMLTGSLSGYVTDSDSTQGLKGKLIRRDGQLLAKSMLAGFASGLSSIASQAGTDQVQTVSGAINSTINTDRILETGGAEGVNTTMEALAERYLEEAKNLFPVISVSGGRIGTIVLTRDVKLEWKSYSGRYEQRVEPESSQTPKLF